MTPAFVFGKVGRGLLTLLIAVSFVFVVLRLAGDPVSLMLPDDTSPDVVERYRQIYGLDRSVPEQYLSYVSGLLHGDFGYSFRDGRPALDVVVDRIPQTVLLGLAGILVTVAVGVTAGVIAALWRGTVVDRAAMGLAILGASVPNFFLGIIFILLFSMTWRMLPSSGIGTFWHLLMPALTLGLSGAGGAGSIARFTRSSMLEVLHQPYMRTAKAKGLRPTRRVLMHAIPNASLPVITVLGMRLGGVVAGAVVVETVFAWPGVGQLLATAVSARDLAIVQTVVLLVALTMVLVNLLVDIAYGWLDPRLAARGAA
jgi:peptide/nickel transport system permease protein